MLYLCSKRMALFGHPRSLKGALRVQAPSLSPWMQKVQESKVCTPPGPLGKGPCLMSRAVMPLDLHVLSTTNALSSPYSEDVQCCITALCHSPSLLLVCVADGKGVDGEQRTGRSRRSTRKVTDFALMHEGNTQELTAKVVLFHPNPFPPQHALLRPASVC